MEKPAEPSPESDLSDHPPHMRDPRGGEREDPHAGYSDDPRVDPTPDHHQSG